MKKLGAILALALFAQTAIAGKPDAGLANLAVLVAETGASANWETAEIAMEAKLAEKLEAQVTRANRQLDKDVEKRIQDRLEAYTAQ